MAPGHPRGASELPPAGGIVNPAVRAVVVRWRGGDEIRRCLASLLDHGGPHLAGVVLVDSGSGDGGAECLATEFPSAQVLSLPENHGFAYAADHGCAEGDEPFLLLLNPDAEITQGAIEALVSLLDDHPGAAGAIPLLEGGDGESQHRWQLRRLPTPLRLALGLSGTPAFTHPPSDPSPVAQPAAAAWLVRRSVWDALGGLDPIFAPAWWEDVDFCARLGARLGDPDFPADEGFVVQPAARVRHAGGSSLSGLVDSAFLAVFFYNLLLYAGRHHHEHLNSIRRGLRGSLTLRGLLRPSRREAYKAALATLAVADEDAG